MSIKKKILLIDEDSNYISSLRRSLSDGGYELVYWDQGEKALEIIRNLNPDLIISEISMSRIDGHNFFDKIKSIPEVKDVPFIFLSSQKRVDDRIKSMELGVDDFITKPFYIEEVVARIENLFEEVNLIEEKKFQHEKGFTGSLSELGLIELIQTLEMGRKSGIIHLNYKSFEGTVYVKEGRVIDAIMNELPPRDALMRMFVWTEGMFHVEMIQIDHEKRIESNNDALITQGKDHINLWEKLKRNLPPLETPIKSQDAAISQTNNLTNFEKNMISSLAGNQSIYDIIVNSSLDDLKTLEIINDLFKKGYLVESEFDTSAAVSTIHTRQGLSQEKIKSENRKDKIISLILSDTEHESQQMMDRRHGERRKQDRRKNDRRKNKRLTNNKVYLDKAELLLIREKLT